MFNPTRWRNGTRFFRLSHYYRFYSSLIAKPHFLHVLGLLPNMLLRGASSSYRDFQRFLSANRLPGKSEDQEGELPEIEIVICAAKKDFTNLRLCVEQAIKHSANPISRVTVIVPADQLESCRKLLVNLPVSRFSDLQIVNEESLIPDQSRSHLRKSLQKSYGWGLQQFLTVAFVIQSSSSGVLAINADTFVLQPRNWLRKDGTQELLVSSEFHPPYYEVLRSIDPQLSFFRNTFVCHQMLFQPKLLRGFLAEIGLQNITEYINLILQKADLSRQSPFCAEFEFYAQSLCAHFPNRAILLRFANVPFSFSSDEAQKIIQIRVLESQKHYNSVSSHSWQSD